MKAVVQRVSEAAVTVDGKIVGAVGKGVLVLLGVEKGDTVEEANWLAEKIGNLRIFEDDGGKMNLSLLDSKGEMLAVSQFTLAGNCSKGRRPSFDTAAPPEEANHLYQYFVGRVWELGIPVQTGIFQADMKVSLVNDGPVTFILDTRNATFPQFLR
jgi:D-tyrosyl-tRNA(Tyr) deacylase